MGKASSAKKVARVARTSGGTGAGRERFRLGYGAGIALLIVVGVVLVLWSRAGRQVDSGPSADEQWTITWGAYVCDAFVPGVGGQAQVTPVDPENPENRSTLGTWAPSANLTISDASITLPDGTVLSSGQDCNGQPAELSVTSWAPGAAADRGLTQTFGFPGIQFGENGESFTFAVVPAGTTVPPPPATPEPAPSTSSTTAATDTTTDSSVPDTSSTTAAP
jgi:hypothetical protein